MFSHYILLFSQLLPQNLGCIFLIRLLLVGVSTIQLCTIQEVHSLWRGKNTVPRLHPSHCLTFCLLIFVTSFNRYGSILYIDWTMLFYESFWRFIFLLYLLLPAPTLSSFTRPTGYVRGWFMTNGLIVPKVEWEPLPVTTISMVLNITRFCKCFHRYQKDGEVLKTVVIDD